MDSIKCLRVAFGLLVIGLSVTGLLIGLGACKPDPREGGKGSISGKSPAPGGGPAPAASIGQGMVCDGSGQAQGSGHILSNTIQSDVVILLGDENGELLACIPAGFAGYRLDIPAGQPAGQVTLTAVQREAYENGAPPVEVDQLTAPEAENWNWPILANAGIKGRLNLTVTPNCTAEITLGSGAVVGYGDSTAPTTLYLPRGLNYLFAEYSDCATAEHNVEGPSRWADVPAPPAAPAAWNLRNTFAGPDLDQGARLAVRNFSQVEYKVEVEGEHLRETTSASPVILGEEFQDLALLVGQQLQITLESVDGTRSRNITETLQQGETLLVSIGEDDDVDVLIIPNN